MRSYKEMIKDDNFDIKDEYSVDTHVTKMCWGCETKHEKGHMVRDLTKLRRIFFCNDCFAKLKK